MTVNSDLSRVRYMTNGQTTEFAVPFPYMTNNDGTAQLSVYFDDRNTPLLENKDYYVVGLGNYNHEVEQDDGLIVYEERYDSGTVIFYNAPEKDKAIAIVRNVTLTQGIQFINGEEFPAEDFSNALDKLTMAVQELKENQGRSVILPPTSDIKPIEIRDIIIQSANEAKETAIEGIKRVNEAIEELETKLDAYYTKEETDQILTDYYTKEEVDQSIDNVNVILGGYYTKEEVTEEITKTVADYATKEEVNHAVDNINVALANVYTKEEVDHAIASAQPEMTADKVEYNNGSITSVQEALDQLLYVMPSITSFAGGGTYEVGQSIASINFSWALNKAVTSQSINQGIGNLDPSVRSYNYTPSTPIRTNITYTLSVSDGKNTATRSTSLAFRYKRYWGVSTKDTLTNADILALSKELTTGRTQSRTFNCSGGKYFYFVIPTEYCSGISFKVGGLAFSDMQSSDITLTNESGASVACKVYRSKNLQTGSAISVEVL